MVTQSAATLLPHGFPHSVSGGYLSFMQLQMVAAVAGSAGMVFSTQTVKNSYFVDRLGGGWMLARAYGCD